MGSMDRAQDDSTVDEVSRLQAQVDAFRAMADSHPALLWSADTTGLCTEFNRSWLLFRGRSLEEELGVGWLEGVHPDDSERCMSTYLEAFGRRESFQMEYRLQRADGIYRWILDRGAPRESVDGEFAGYIGSCVDITEHRRREDELTDAKEMLTRAAMRDLLTGLGNRALLVEQGRALLDRAAMGDHGGVGLLFADVNGFKKINDDNGHDVGDKVLVDLAEALRHAVRPKDVATRWGGDEFVVLCEDVADPAALEEILCRVRERAVVHLGATVVRMTIGSAFVPAGEVTRLDDLVPVADADMYRRKVAGRQ